MLIENQADSFFKLQVIKLQGKAYSLLKERSLSVKAEFLYYALEYTAILEPGFLTSLVN